jgi:hypothetical protein
MKKSRKSANKKLAEAALPTLMSESKATIPPDSPVKLSTLLASESLCDKLRRLGREEEDKFEAERVEHIRKIVGDNTFTPQKNSKGYYIICGYEWSLEYVTHYNDELIYGLRCESAHNRFKLSRCYGVYSPETLGGALIQLDKQKGEIDAEFPNTLWGNLRAWWNANL